MGGITSVANVKPVVLVENDVGFPFVHIKYVDLLVNSGHDIKNVGGERIGCEAFNELFEAAPETLNMFGHFCDDPNYKTNIKYIHHCKTVVNVIGSFTQILQKKELLTHHLNFLGFQHNLRNISRRHFTLFGEKFMLALGDFLPYP